MIKTLHNPPVQVQFPLSEPVRTTLQVITAEDGFLDLRGSWDRIISEAKTPGPLQDWDYVWTWWKSFGRRCPETGRPGHLHCVVVRSEAEIVGIVPFFWTEPSRFSLLPKRLRQVGYSGKLEPFGMTEEPLAAISPGHEELVVGEVLRELDGGLAEGSWDGAVFLHPCVSPERARTLMRSTRKPGSAHVPLPSSWREFRSSLSRSMRDNLAYYPRLLDRAGFKREVLWSDEDLSFEEALGELIRLHKARAWLSEDARRRDHLPALPQIEFIRNLRRARSATVRVSIAILTVNGIAVAAHLLIEGDDTLVLGYSGFDPVFSKFSPLLVLQSEVIQDAIRRGVKRLNLLGGAAAWQERWRPRREFPYMKETLVSRRFASRLKCVAYLAARESRSFWEHSRLKRLVQQQRIARTSK